MRTKYFLVTKEMAKELRLRQRAVAEATDQLNSALRSLGVELSNGYSIRETESRETIILQYPAVGVNV